MLSAALVFGCASPVTETRCLTVEPEASIGLTLPYTLEIDDGIRCEVLAAKDGSEVLRCYRDDPSWTLGPREQGDAAVRCDCCAGSGP